MHKKTKYAALLLSFLLILTAVLGATLAVIVVSTPSLINTFLSGFDPTGDLTIRKTISHPFGSSYVVPDNDNTRFLFTVDFGPDYANRTYGEFRTDSEGKLTLTIKAGSSVTIPELPLGIQATVTEHTPGPGFAAQEPQTVTIAHGENLLSVVNPYTPSPAENTLTVQGSKSLVGRDWQPGDRFVFALEVKENGQWKELGQQVVEFTEESDPETFYTFDFTQIIREYSLEQAGVHSFRVIEKEGSIPGITYDKAESKFDITVGDQDMDGAMEIQSVTSPSANTTVRNHTVWIDFQNAYAPLGSVEVYLDILKNLTDTSGQDKRPSGFAFELYNEAGELVQTSAPTDADGRTEIRLIFETKHAGHAYVYTLKEINQEAPGITYDETVYTFRVDVSADSDGTVSALLTLTDTQIPGQDEDSQEDPEEDVPSAPAENLPMETEPEVTEPEVTEPEATVPETTVPETTAPAEEPLVIMELQASASAANAQEAEAQEEAQPEEEDTAVRTEVTFTNIYEPTAATLPISGSKTLTGRGLKAGEFTFLLYETEAGFVIGEGAEPVRSAVNEENGRFVFEELTFTRAGWHYFVAVEDPSPALGGITYDTTRYQIRVFVEDVGGRLSVQEVTVENTAGEAADILFRNTYAPAEAIFNLSGRKILTGRDLQAEEFTFHLYEASYLTSYGFTKGQLYARSANGLDTEGEDIFSFCIEYPQSGTFYYIVTEVAGEEEGMTYDAAEYGIEVVVRDNQAGSLEAEVTRIVKIGQEDTPLEEILFENTYEEPEETQPDETTEATTEPDETQPTGGGGTPPDGPGKPGEPDGTEETEGTEGTESEEEKEDEKLPQTGQLWWPVPILLIMGVVFILIGLIRRRGTRYED